MTEYQDQKLDLITAENAVEAGIAVVWQLLELGRLKLFSTLQYTKQECGLYRRARKVDENGVTTVKIVKKNDHLMDCMRYGVNTFDKIAKVKPIDKSSSGSGFQPADKLAGY